MTDDDDLLPLSELAKRLPAVRGQRPPNRSTLYRWATVGLKSRGGERIRLDATFIGGTLCASLADVRRLGQKKCDADFRQPEVVSDREREAARKRGEAAMERLKQAGFV